MNKKILISLSLIVLVVFIITFIGYFVSRRQQNQKTSEIYPRYPETPKEPINVSKTNNNQTQSQVQNQSPGQNLKGDFFLPSKFNPLINEEFSYIDFKYPLIYVYDPLSGTIKYIDLEEEAYKDLIKIEDYERALFSNDKNKVFIQTSQEIGLVDIQTDRIARIPKTLVKNFYFDNKNRAILFKNNENNNASLYFFDKGKETKIIDLAILNPEFEILKDNLLLYEKNSPIFSINLKKPTSLNLFLEEPLNYDLISNKNKNLLAISFLKDGNWQSKIIDSDKKSKYVFYWPVIKEKCTFEDFLICAIPFNLENFDKDYWRLLKPNYDEKIIIYNPENDEIKEIALTDKFDILKPHLTKKGLIFVNRNDNKIYLLNLENNKNNE